MLRTHDMVWVDLLIDRDAVQEAIRLLATSSIIELRAYDRSDLPFEMAGDQQHLQHLGALHEKLAHYRRYLTGRLPDKGSSVALQTTAEALPHIDSSVSQWLQRVARPVAELERTQAMLEEYALLQQCLTALPSSEYDLRYFVTLSKSNLFSSFIALGTHADSELFRDAEGQVVYNAYPLDEDDQQCVFIGVVATPQVPELERAAHSRNIRFIRVPDSIQGDAGDAKAQLQELKHAATQKARALRAEIDRASEALGMADVVWQLNRHLWVSRVMADALVGTRFVWLGGWIAAQRYDELLRVLESGGVPFLVNRDAAGEHGPPPALLDNPTWMRKFEVFVRGFGMPAPNNVDPTPLLAITTPLMFGYMFGDVGHGAVLFFVGWLLRRRIPVLALLMPAGLVSMLFGFAFGSVFCYEHLVPALWLHPMAEPLTILGVPLVFGFVLITSGLLLAGVQARWQAGTATWVLEHFPVILMYSVALPLALWDWRVGVLPVVIGAIWYVAARALPGIRKLAPLAAASGAAKGLLELVELLAQLLINTISFARLGAFALAHAGLSSAVIVLSDLTDSWWLKAPVLITGNVLVIALEGLVVSIQTTRLIMFEFFRRFYAGEGSGFKPLTLPRNHGSLPN